MRLWHKDLIPYLPKKQLLGQWRELNSIYKLQNRHILINFVYDYSYMHLYSYSMLVLKELKSKNYKYNLDNMSNYFGINNFITEKNLYENWLKKEDIEEMYKDKMNDRYLRQCLYNLQEKYDCGGISKEEWQIIEDKFGEYLK